MSGERKREVDGENEMRGGGVPRRETTRMRCRFLTPSPLILPLCFFFALHFFSFYEIERNPLLLATFSYPVFVSSANQFEREERERERRGDGGRGRRERRRRGRKKSSFDKNTTRRLLL